MSHLDSDVVLVLILWVIGGHPLCRCVRDFESMSSLSERSDVVFLAVPHRVMSDDKYHGYDIPEGCMVMPNIWSVILPVYV